MFKNVSKFLVMNYIHCTHIVFPFVTSRPSVLYYILLSKVVKTLIKDAVSANRSMCYTKTLL